MKDFILGNILNEDNEIYSINLYPNKPYYRNLILFGMESPFPGLFFTIHLTDNLILQKGLECNAIVVSLPINKQLLRDSDYEHKSKEIDNIYSAKDILAMQGKTAKELNNRLSEYILKYIEKLKEIHYI